MENDDLLDLQARALFVHDEHRRLVRANERNGAIAPAVFIGWGTAGTLLRLRNDLPDAAIAIAERFAGALPPWQPGGHVRVIDDLADALAAHIEPRARWQGPAFAFPPPILPPFGAMQLFPGNAGLLHPELATLGPDLPRRRPTFAVMRGGAAVCVCYSARWDERAAEAGVETVSAFRGQGCAGLAVAAWADAIRATGRQALYSTSWENTASLAVAAKLELIQFADNIHLG